MYFPLHQSYILGSPDLGSSTCTFILVLTVLTVEDIKKLTFRNSFYDYNRTIETVKAIFAHAHLNKKSHERQIWTLPVTTYTFKRSPCCFLVANEA